MTKDFYLPHTDEGKMTWLSNFAGKLPAHAAELGIITEQITSVQNDSNMFTYMVNLVNFFKAGLSERVGYKDILKNGPEGTVVGPVPVFNHIAPPTVVPSGIFNRVRRLVQNIKSNDNYNDSIGNDLGIIGAEQGASSLDMKPVLKIRMDAGKPRISWKKGNVDSIDIFVDRGDGKGFIYLANDSSPDFTDNSTLSSTSNIAEWKYKAIYRIKDEQIGQFSDEVSTTVKREIA